MMSEKIKFTIDGKACTADKGTNIVDAAKEKWRLYSYSLPSGRSKTCGFLQDLQC